MSIGGIKEIAALARVQEAAKDAMTKNLGEYFNNLDKQNNAIIDQLNQLLLAEVTNYELSLEIAKKIGAKIPKPKTEMTIEE